MSKEVFEDPLGGVKGVPPLLKKTIPGPGKDMCGGGRKKQKEGETLTLIKARPYPASAEGAMRPKKQLNQAKSIVRCQRQPSVHGHRKLNKFQKTDGPIT